MLTLTEGGIAYLRDRHEHKRPRHIGLFESARGALHRRLHQHGVAH